MPRVTDPSVLSQLAPPGSLGGVVIGTHAPDPKRPGELTMQQQSIAKNAVDLSMSADQRRKAKADADRAEAEARKAQADLIGSTPAATPGNASLTGEEYLKTLPAPLAAQVKMLSEGRRPFPAGAAMRSPAIQELIAAAAQYDPTLDAANSATRVATRKEFTSGMTARNITAINTALGHLGSLSSIGKKLNNTSFPLYNSVANALVTASGDARTTEFDIKRHAVVDELEKAFRGSGGTQAGIEEWKQSINAAQSPEQMRAAIATGVELLNSRLEALNGQYSQGMGRSSDPLQLLNPHAREVFNALGPNGTGVLDDHAPTIGGASGSVPPGIGGGSPSIGGPGAPRAPGGLGGPRQPSPDATEVASGATRTERNTVAEKMIEHMILAGKSATEINAQTASMGIAPVSQASVETARAYVKTHPDYRGFVQSYQEKPQTAFQQVAGSPVGAALGGFSNGIAMGGLDEINGGIAALTGGDYTRARDAFDFRKKALAAANPTSDLIGNIGGGVTGMLAAPELLARYAPGALGAGANIAARIGRAAPIAGDAAYGGVYGGLENNENRLGGGGLGALLGAGGGATVRGGVRGLGSFIAPTGGNMAPLYEQGVFPTIGQRFADSGWAGKAVNTTEQAMQSIPVAGALVARAREIPRDALQIGGFNKALSEIGDRLPAGMEPGTAPHAYAKPAFDRAYDTARSGMQFVPDQPYLADLNGFMQTLDNGVLSKDQADQVRQVIQNSVDSRLRGGQMAGDGYKAAASDLGRAAEAWASNPNTSLQADALKGYLTIFDGAARRNSHPQAVAALDAADRGYAQLVRLQKASERVGGNAGEFTPKGLDRAVQQEAGGVRSGPYLRGEALMQDYASAGKNLSDTLGNSGTADRLEVRDLLTGQVAGGGALGAGAVLGAPVSSAAIPGALAFSPYLPGLNKLVTRGMAPNSARLPELGLTLDPAILDALGAQIKNRAASIGRIGVPAALAWGNGQ
jgi:hypothetical protein